MKLDFSECQTPEDVERVLLQVRQSAEYKALKYLQELVRDETNESETP